MAETRRVLETGAMDEPAMTALAGALAPGLTPPLVIALKGDLGAGKTTFVRALVQGLGHQGRVKSPTYGLLEHYPLDALDVLHLDLYRIGEAGELEFLGITDLLGERTVLLVEWPERGAGALPSPDLTLELASGTGAALDSRRLTFYAHSASGKDLCDLVDSLL